MPIFHAKLLNFVAVGDDVTQFSSGAWSRNIFNLSIELHQLRIVQNPEIIRNAKNNLRGRSVETSNVKVMNIDDATTGKQIVTDLASLLSFACQSPIRFYEYNFEGHSESWSVSGAVNSWRPPFDANETGAIKTFIESCWNNFQCKKDSRALNHLFDLMNYGDQRGDAVEIHLALTAMCLESIATYYALSEGPKKGIQETAKGQFAKGKELFGFKKLLELAMLDVKMQPPAQSWENIIAIRNAIIHRGFIRPQDAIVQNIFGLKNEDQLYRMMFTTLEAMHDLIREFLLRLLGYRRRYYTYSSSARETAEI